jgi:hypothetical protein
MTKSEQLKTQQILQQKCVIILTVTSSRRPHILVPSAGVIIQNFVRRIGKQILMSGKTNYLKGLRKNAKSDDNDNS